MVKILPYVHLLPIVIFVEILGGWEKKQYWVLLFAGLWRKRIWIWGWGKDDCLQSGNPRGSKKFTLLNAPNSLIGRLCSTSHFPNYKGTEQVSQSLHIRGCSELFAGLSGKLPRLGQSAFKGQPGLDVDAQESILTVQNLLELCESIAKAL